MDIQNALVSLRDSLVDTLEQHFNLDFYNMLSRQQILAYTLTALGAVQTVRGGAPLTCSGTLALSCHNTTAQSNTCCFNSPGGLLLQTQFWDTSPAVGPSNSWTIHGLWPDNCDGTYDANCDDSRAYTNITDILKSFGEEDLLNYMNTYWLPNSGSGETFWEHEWGKHGTCISTIEPKCFSNYQSTEEVPYFFNKTVSLFKSLPTYDWLNAAGITPSSSQTYTLSDIQSALSKNHGANVYIGCASGALDEVWYYYNVKGSALTGEYVAAPPDAGSKSTCPSTGIKYLPKGSSGGSPTATATKTTTKTTAAPTGTSAPFSGKGYLNVITGGKTNGCVISGGTWYTSGTCATFTATSGSGGSYTLKSSKGNCAVSNGTLTCGSTVGTATSFGSNGSKMTYAGSSNFYASAVASGSTQQQIFTQQSGHGTTLQIEWQSV